MLSPDSITFNLLGLQKNLLVKPWEKVKRIDGKLSTEGVGASKGQMKIETKG